MNMPKTKRNVVLIADDDIFLMVPFVDLLEDRGYQVIKAETGQEVLDRVKARKGSIDVAILDILMRWNKYQRSATVELAGFEVARMLKKSYPSIRLVGFSVVRDESVINWFKQYGDGYLQKPCTPGQLLDRVHIALQGKPRRKPKCFIVHGHDEKTLRDLQQFLRHELAMTDIVVLREQPNLGRTIIEKFEDYASTIDVAFVLLTPDDRANRVSSSRASKMRARQNVIFELGYFYGQLRRSAGRTILLYKGKLELPSDITSIAYVDISKGFNKKNQKKIRQELAEWM